MKKTILIGRSECGKTTLMQALRGEQTHYDKTQAIEYGNDLIDTPGEYAQTKTLGGALAVYSYESDLIILAVSACEPFSLFPPCITGQANREVVGVVTKIDLPNADPERAERWLRIAGCETVFRVSSKTGEGIDALRKHLQE